MPVGWPAGERAGWVARPTRVGTHNCILQLINSQCNHCWLCCYSNDDDDDDDNNDNLLHLKRACMSAPSPARCLLHHHLTISTILSSHHDNNCMQQKSLNWQNIIFFPVLSLVSSPLTTAWQLLLSLRCWIRQHNAQQIEKTEEKKLNQNCKIECNLN